jgi:hypothetical protein
LPSWVSDPFTGICSQAQPKLNMRTTLTILGLSSVLLSAPVRANDPSGSWLSYAAYTDPGHGRITMLNTTWTVPNKPTLDFGPLPTFIFCLASGAFPCCRGVLSAPFDASIFKKSLFRARPPHRVLPGTRSVLFAITEHLTRWKLVASPQGRTPPDGGLGSRLPMAMAH